MPNILPQLILFTAWAALLRLIEVLTDFEPAASPAVHGIVGTALGLLLVFRTNSAYDRFWEGRKKWGMIINRTRDFARQGLVWMDDVKANENVVRMTIAFAYACRSHLRGHRDLEDVDDLLSSRELANAEKAGHQPMFFASEMTKIVREAQRAKRIDAFDAMQMNRNVTQLVDELGACERIKKTPIPFSYVMHLRRFIVLYILTLPFALYDLGWWMVPSITGITYAFLGIEAIGIDIEDPFGLSKNDLPLGDICDTIRQNLIDMLKIKLKSDVSDGKVDLVKMFEPLIAGGTSESKRAGIIMESSVFTRSGDRL